MEDKSIKLLAIGIVAVLAVASVTYLLWPNDTPEGQEEEITLAFGYSSGYQPMLYAWKAGLFEAEGVNVKVNLVDSSGPSVAALLSGKADMAFTSPEPVFSTLADGALSIQVLCNSRLPGMSSMHALYNNISIDTTDLVRQCDTDGVTEIPSEIGLINFANAVVGADGTINGKIALHMASSYRAAWIGYIELLYRGGTVYGVKYPAGNINLAQYNLLKDTSNSSVYLPSENYAAAATFTLTGSALIGIGSNAAMASAAAEGNSAHPGQWNIMSTPSLVDSGFSTVLASQNAIDTKYDQIVKVLRAIDKAGALMRDPSTATMVAKVCAPLIYSAGARPMSEYVQSEIDYYSQVRWDICMITNTPEVFENIANISNLNADGHFNVRFATIYHADFIRGLMQDVHQGGQWQRNEAWQYI